MTAKFSTLSTRQRLVATLIAKGMDRQSIAAALRWSPRVVDGLRYQAIVKLGVSNNVQLTWLALQEGVVQAPEEWRVR